MAATTIGKLVYLITGDSSYLKNELNKVRRTLSSFGKDLQDAGARLTKGLTLPIVAAGTAALKFAADLETQRTAFGVLLGDVDKGAALFEQLKKFSAETPLQLEDITRGAQTLLAFGTAAEDVLTKLRVLGDLAQGDAARMQTLTEAYGKLQAKGRASLEELNRFTENGVPLMAALARQLGVTTGELFKMVEQGDVTFADVDAALKSMTDAGGQFHDMMLTVSKTTAGKFSTAVDNLKLAAASLVESLLPAVNTFLDLVTKGAEQVMGWDDATKKMVLTILGITAAIGPLLMVLGALSKAIATNPWVVLGVAIAAATLTVIAYTKAKREAAEASQKLLGKLKETKEITDQETLAIIENTKAQAVLREQQIKPYVELKEREVAVMERDIAALQEQIRLAGNSRGSVQALGEKYAALVQKHDAATRSLGEMNRELKIQEGIYTEADRLAQDYNRKKAEEAAATEGAAAATRGLTAAREDELQGLRDRNAEQEDGLLTAGQILEMERLSREARTTKDLEEAAARQAEKDKQLQDVQQVMGAVSSLTSALGGVASAEANARLAEIDDEYQRRKAAIEANVADETERTAAIQALDDEFSAKRRDAEREAAKASKGYAIFGVLLDTASAVVNALATTKPFFPLGLIMSALAAATGAAQLAAINATPLPAAGGADFITSGPQLMMVGDNPGGEEQVSVTPVSSPNMAGPEGEMLHVTVNLDGRPIADFVTTATRRRQILIDAGAVT